MFSGINKGNNYRKHSSASERTSSRESVSTVLVVGADGSLTQKPLPYLRSSTSSGVPKGSSGGLAESPRVRFSDAPEDPPEDNPVFGIPKGSSGGKTPNDKTSSKKSNIDFAEPNENSEKPIVRPIAKQYLMDEITNLGKMLEELYMEIYQEEEKLAHDGESGSPASQTGSKSPGPEIETLGQYPVATLFREFLHTTNYHSGLITEILLSFRKELLKEKRDELASKLMILLRNGKYYTILNEMTSVGVSGLASMPATGPGGENDRSGIPFLHSPEYRTTGNYLKLGMPEKNTRKIDIQVMLAALLPEEVHHRDIVLYPFGKTSAGKIERLRSQSINFLFTDEKRIGKVNGRLSLHNGLYVFVLHEWEYEVTDSQTLLKEIKKLRFTDLVLPIKIRYKGILHI